MVTCGKRPQKLTQHRVLPGGGVPVGGQRDTRRRRDVTVNLGVNGYWVYGGRVNQIRIDPASNGNSSSSDTIVIDKAWFTW